MKPNLNSARAKEARLAKRIGNYGSRFLAIFGALLAGEGIWQITRSNYPKYGYISLALSTLSLTICLWYFKKLTKLPANLNSNKLEEQLSASVLANLPNTSSLNPRIVWQALSRHWQTRFILGHLLLDPALIEQELSDKPEDMNVVWQNAKPLTIATGANAIEPGLILTSLIRSNETANQYLKKVKLQPNDITETASWLIRGLESMDKPKQSFGGIGRDWAFGYTPLLSQFGNNISLAIASAGGSNFTALSSSSSVKAIETAVTNQSGGIAIIGESGSGKTSHIYALAQKLIEGNSSNSLAYHQVIGLDASQIISKAQSQGALEQIVLRLVNEAIHSKNIILFFDDAKLFLANDTGSFDATKILEPLVENRVIPAIFALTPTDYERLKVSNPSFAGLLTPVVLQEPTQSEVMRILEDTTNGFENRFKVLIAFEALKSAYELSGRYNQDKVYPGRAIDLLEQAVNHANNKLVSSDSVERAIEQTYGVKVSRANTTEASELLNLEDKIHERMINQSRAVSVVSSALRRARAGVASTSRPIGSFLFLGPTGVGKTELAKSISATYFGDEHNMIRLDMSEYQQEADVSRLLSNGSNESSSLIMKIRTQPFSVVLLDEIEKAHPNILNLLLQLLDEGQLTDSGGKTASFKDAIIIATSNAGADTIRAKIEAGEELESFEKEFTDQLINSGQFKPELLNRFDEIVLFRPLKSSELAQVVHLMLAEVNRNLSKQNISVELTDDAIAKIVEKGNDPRLGARPMRRAIQRLVEDNIANRILSGSTQPGDKIILGINDIENEQ